VDAWNYGELFEQIAAAQPGATAIIQGERRLSWADFERRSRGVAAWLFGLGAEHQDKVALYLHNSPEYLEGTVAAMRAGLVPVNTNYRYRTEELVYLWDNADAIAVIFHGAFAETIESIRGELPKIRAWLWVDDGSGPCPGWAEPYESAVERAPAELDERIVRGPDDLLLLYTGGTTGAPKGVMWRQDDILARMNTIGFRRWDLDAPMAEAVTRIAEEGPGWPQLPACPLMHGSGLFTTLEALVEGGSAVLLEHRHYDPAELAATIDREGVRVVVIVGDPFARPLAELLESEPGRYSLASVHAMVSSGAMWTEEVKARLLAQQPSMLLVDAIGSTEAIGMGSSVSRAGKEKKTGRFRISPEVRVLDESDRDVEPGSGATGVLALGGRIPLGYYKDPDRSAATFRSVGEKRYSLPGDVAQVEADGTVLLLGRGSSSINTAGEKVFGEEVEEVLKRHELVVDACVVGIPDERTGQRVVAAVSLAPGASVATEQLRSFVREHLASYKVPKSIRIVDTIERSPAGKLDYRRQTDEAIAWEADQGA
jgi:fatty-acyl-CoA synthase